MAIFNTVILPYFSCGLPTTIPEASFFHTYPPERYRALRQNSLNELINLWNNNILFSSYPTVCSFIPHHFNNDSIIASFIFPCSVAVKSSERRITIVPYR